MGFDEPIRTELYDAHGNKIVLTDLYDTCIENNKTYMPDGISKKGITLTCKADHMTLILVKVAAQLVILSKKETR